MSEIEAAPAGRKGSALPLVGIGLLLLVGVAVLAYFSGGGKSIGGGPIKQVGSLDQEAVFTMPEFEKAKKDLEAKAKTKEAEMEKYAHELGENPTPEQQKAFENKAREIKLALSQESNKLLNPLKNRAEYAVAQVAAQKGITVVLDKRIIVYGVPEITDDVKKAFETAKPDAKITDPPDTANAPIGYFDQEVVRTLKVFQENEVKIYQMRQKMGLEFQDKSKDMKTAAEKELLERQLKLKLEAYQEQLTTPLVQAVNEAVKEVAQAEGLSLVLDKQHVMQGGRNMTDKVVETFLKKVGSAPGGAPATPGAPTPVNTP